jgi:hypothetical protein
MDRHTEAMDVYSILNAIFFVSKVLGMTCGAYGVGRRGAQGVGVET